MYLIAVVLFFVGAIIILQRRKRKRLPIDNKCILITGCDSGIGLFMALSTAKLGFRVIATCLNRDNPNVVLSLVDNPSIHVLELDVTKTQDVESVKRCVESYLLEHNLTLWAVINNAGVMVYGNFDWLLESQVKQQIDVNLMGVLHMSKAFLPLLRSSQGRLINITSANGRWCLPGLSIYCATKFAVEGFSNALRMELKPYQVKVILINPGNVPTKTRILAYQKEHAEKMKAQMSLSDWEEYGNYFDCFQEHLCNAFCFSASPTEDNSLSHDAGLQAIVASSLLDENPNQFYTNLPSGFKWFLRLFGFLPGRTADGLILKMWGQSIGWDWKEMKRHS